MKIVNEYLDHLQEREALNEQMYNISHADILKLMNISKVSGAAWVGLVASVLTLAYAAYKEHFSKAAQACESFSGIDKTNCVNKYKREAKRNQITALKSGLKFCKSSKNPTKCSDKIMSRVRKLQADLGELR